MVSATRGGLWGLAVASMLAAVLLAGCGGGGSGSTTTFVQMDALSTRAVQDDPPAVGDIAGVVGQVTGAATDDGLIGLVSPAGRASRAFEGGVINTDLYGLHFDGSLEVAFDPLVVSGEVAITGTLAGTGTAADGSVVDLVFVANVTSGVGTISLAGDITAPDSRAYHVEFTRTIGLDGSVWSVHTVGLITQGDIEVFTEDITRTVDLSAAFPRPRTLNGTMTVRSPDAPASFVTATFTDLVYLPADGHYDYTGGSMTIVDETGRTASLAAQPDFSLSGLVTRGGLNVATMTIADGEVTITPL